MRIATFVRESLPSQDYAATVDRLRFLDKATRGLTSQQRVGIPKPCAFLQDNRCVIYPVRPLACAEFTSYDVQVCKRGKRVGFKPGAVTHEKARLLAYGAVQRGLFEGLKRAVPQSDCEPLELTAASLVALDAPDAARVRNEIAPNDQWVKWMPETPKQWTGLDSLFGSSGTKGFATPAEILVQPSNKIFDHNNVIEKDVITSQWMPYLNSNRYASDEEVMKYMLKKYDPRTENEA